MSFRPSCIGCCGNCDSQSVLTSCQHFLCANCSHNLVRDGIHFCPKCKISCSVVQLGDPKFPKNIRERVVGNSTCTLRETLYILDFQSKQQVDIAGRAKEIISHLQLALRDGTAQISKLKGEIRALEADLRSIQNKLEHNNRKYKEDVNSLTEKISAYESEKESRDCRMCSPAQSSRQYLEVSSSLRHSLPQFVETSPTHKTHDNSTFAQIASSTRECTPFREPSFSRSRVDFPPETYRRKLSHDVLFPRQTSGCSNRGQNSYKVNSTNPPDLRSPFLPPGQSGLGSVKKIINGENLENPSNSRWGLPRLLPEK